MEKCFRRYYNIKFLLFLVVFQHVSLFGRKANGLFCYKCNWLRENQKCNEEEPVYCGDNEVCVTISDEAMFKGCRNDCPVSRGDDPDALPCKKCNTDLCNGNPEEKVDLGIQRYSDATTPNGTKYVLYVKDATFWEARLRCSMDGGILATIHSPAIQNFLNENFLSNAFAGAIMENSPPGASLLMDEGAAWLGLQLGGNSNSAWIWTDDGSVLPSSGTSCGDKTNESQFENWMKGHPLNSSATCGYATRESGGMWKSGSCGGVLPSFLCEYPENVQVQSVVREDQVFIFKTSLNGSLTCDDKNQEQEAPEYEIGLKFRYFWKYRFKPSCLQWKAAAEKLPEPDCGSSGRFIICQRPFVLDSCKNETREDTATRPSTEVTPRSTERCDSYTKEEDGVTFSFTETKIQRFSYSIEKCPDGRPRAMMFCKRSIQPVLEDFITIDCEKNLMESYSEVTGVRNLSHLMEKIQAFHEAALLGNEFSPNGLVSMALSLAQESNNLSVSYDALSHVVAAISEIRGNTPTKRNRTTDFSNMIANFSNLPLVLEMLAQRVDLGQNESLSLAADGMDVEIVAPDYDAISQGQQVEYSSPDERSVIRITPELPISRSLPSDNLRVVFTTYDNDDLFPTNESSIRVGSVISATVSDGKNTYSVPVEFSMQVSAKKNLAADTCERRECRYYNHSEQRWKNDGCYKEKNGGELTSRNTVKCKCDHTTSFAVVVSQHVRASHALDLVSTIGLSVCFICLSLTVITFLFTPELRRVRSAFIHINLCICLAIAYLVFLVGVEATDDRYGCLTVAALTHFCLLASWGWMAVESATMYRMFVHSFERKVTVENSKVAAIVYTTSAAIVLVTLSLAALAQYERWEEDIGCEDDIWSSYIADGYCWLRGKSLYFGFLLIVGISLSFNIVLACIIIKAITWGRTTVQCSLEEKPIVHVMRAVLVAMLLGLAWIFAVPLAISRDSVVQEVFGWLFALTTFIQGVFVFYFFCIRRKEVRNSWLATIKKPFKKCGPSEREKLSGLAADGSGRSGSMHYLPNIGRTPTSSTVGSEVTQRTTTSCASSFVSPRKQATNRSSVKVVDHSMDMEDFVGEEVFE